MAAKEQLGLHRDFPATGLRLGNPIQDIVERNQRSGRFQRVCKFRHRILTLEEYTDLVSTYYAENYPLIFRLEQGEPEAWERLSRRLFRAAYALLRRQSWDPGEAYTRAQEATQEACLSIYCRVYPYDCPFDAWVFTILRHYVFRSHHRPRNPLDFPNIIDSLDELPEEVSEPTDFTAIEQYKPFLHALSQLHSSAQQQVIDYLFFQELSPEETAQKLGKTIQAVYNLKGRALANLGNLLADEESG